MADPLSYGFTVQVTDGTSATATKQFTLVVAPPGLVSSQGKAVGSQYQGACATVNPIDIGTGNKFQQVTDYRTVGANELGFTRYYNSLVALGGLLGRAWRSTYDRRLILSSATSLSAVRHSGQVVAFTLIGGVWSTDSDLDKKLTQSGTGIGSTWTFIDCDDNVETYTTISSTEARLTSIRARNGYTQTLQYSGALLQSVVDSFGRSLQFTFQNGLLQSLSTPDGLTLSYSYNSSASLPGVNDRLVSVAYSTSPVTSQTYLYENAAFPFALTGIIDENGSRFATYGYDSLGRATSSQHAGGADLVTVVYNADGSRLVTNALGQSELYVFTPLQGVPKITQINRLATATTAAASRTFAYDANGYRASETDWNGNLTTYTNDARGLPTAITQAAGTSQARTTTITYHPTLHLPTKIVEPGLTSDLTYDANGNVLTRTLTDTTTTTIPYSTNGTKRIWTYTWGANGLLASAKGPRTDVNQTSTFIHDGSGTLIRAANALGHQVQVTQHTPGGLPQTVLDPNGVATQLAYDARLRLQSSTIQTSGGPLTTTYAYDAVGNLLSITLPDGSKLTNAYDLAHRLTSVLDLFGQSTAYTLNLLGNRTQTNTRDASNAVRQTRSASFDALGRMVTGTGGAGQLTRFSYDANGNQVSVIDPLNRTTQLAFDPLNRLYRVTDPLSGITTTTYDLQGRPLSVAAPNNAVTTYVYNGFGDLIQQQSPDSGRTVYRYDLAGNLTQVVDARNVVQTRTYDALDRRTATTYPAGAAENITFRYDESGHGFGIGRLTSLTDEAGTLNRSWDERGNITTETRTRGAVTLNTGYSYDPASRIASITYPSGAMASHTRDVMGRITGVTMKPSGAPSPLPVVSNVTYEPFGPVKGLTFGNGVNGTRTFDLDYRLTNLTDGAVQSLTYSYDAANNVLSIADLISSNRSQTFGYDPLDRLTSAAGIYGNQAFTYDSVGNRLTQVAGGTTTNYTYTPQSNRLIRAQTGGALQVFAYTPAGSITSIANVPNTRPTMGIAYNQAGRLARVLAGGAQTLAYSYDAMGHRLVKVGAGNVTTLYQYDQAGHLLEEAGATTTDYIFLGDQPIATFTPGSNTIAFIHTDRLGTPQKATNSGQAISWRGDYEPFGALNAATSQTAGLAQSLRFPGQEFEAETGFHQNWFRDYAPALGRYLESDPIGLTSGTNTYSYVKNRPVRSIDQMGLADYVDPMLQIADRAAGIGQPSSRPLLPPEFRETFAANLNSVAEAAEYAAFASAEARFVPGVLFFSTVAACHAAVAQVVKPKVLSTTVDAGVEFLTSFIPHGERWAMFLKPTVKPVVETIENHGQ